ncbi:uncharacterized protein ACMZJ9_010812 [Mantella aurantiaca]
MIVSLSCEEKRCTPYLQVYFAKTLFGRQDRTLSPYRRRCLNKNVLEPKEIWIIGNFWVNHSALVARKRPNGQNLGLDEKQYTVRWMDKYSLKWHELLTDLSQAASTMGDPDIVFIHLGSSDLGQEKYMKFVSVVKRDLDRLVESYPNTTFIWSSIMPRKGWMKGYMETQRKKFNYTVSGFAKQLGFQVTWLWEVEAMLKDHLQYKSSYALEEVCNVFNRCLKKALETAINKMKK